MPPKKKAGKPQEASKKTAQKQKQKVIEDKTFGLKNKNKSKKVQQHIKSIEKNVMNSGDPRQRKLEEQRKKAKEERKARAKAAKEEQDALFGAALLAVQKKGGQHQQQLNQKEGKMQAKGRDAAEQEGGGNKKATSRAMKMMFQMDAQEMQEKLREDPNYVPTLEDQIEAERQQKVAQLKASGKTGTPVTAETFAAWKERKRKAKMEKAKKQVEAEFKKKKGGKGLSVLSGRDLYEFKKELFNKDDDDDVDDDGSADNGKQNGENGDNNNNNNNNINKSDVEEVAAQVQSDLFLQGDDDDLDDLDDDDDWLIDWLNRNN